MELNPINLIKQKSTYQNFQYLLNRKEKRQIITSYLSLLKLIYIFIILFVFLIFLFNRILIYISHFHFKELKGKKEDIIYYQNLQNNFCDNFRNLINKELEDRIILYNVSLNKKIFEIFIYNNSDYINPKILSNKALEEVSLNLLNVLKN